MKNNKNETDFERYFESTGLNSSIDDGFSIAEDTWNYQQEKINKLEEEKRLYKESNDFYSNIENWFGSESDYIYEAGVRYDELETISEDYEFFNDERKTIGGKLAREIKLKIDNLT